MVNMVEGIGFDVRDEGLRFRKISAGSLTRRQYQDLLYLRHLHYIRELTDLAGEGKKPRDVAQVGTFIAKTTLKSARNLNTLVGSQRRQDQRYSRQTMVLVTDDTDQLRAAFRGEDNASSRILRKSRENGGKPGLKERVLGSMEMAGKLHVPVPRLLEGRHFVVEEMVHDGTLPGLEVVAAGVAAEDFRVEQPVAAYPFLEEEAFRGNLQIMGLTPDNEAPEEVVAFGNGVPKALQERWSAEHLQDVNANIHAIPGASYAIDLAFRSM